MHSSPDVIVRTQRSDRFRDRIARLTANLDASSSTYQTAVLLLTALEVGQGVHKLALVTGFGREFVARCARRLVDNGVWHEGETVSPWTSSEAEDAAFWADVGVAEGKLYRRRSAEGGYEWARPGQWWKEFHYVTSPAAYSAPTRYYAASEPTAHDDSPRQFLSSAEAEPEIEEVPERPVRAPTALPTRAPTALPKVGAVVVVGSPTLFGSAVWLS